MRSEPYSPMEAAARTAATREPTVDSDGFTWFFNPASLVYPPRHRRVWYKWRRRWRRRFKLR